MVDHNAAGEAGHNEGGGIHKPASCLINLWLVLLDPHDLRASGLRGQSVATGVEDVVLAKAFVHFVNFVHRTGVNAVKDAIAQWFEVLVHGEHIRADGTDAHTLDLVGGNTLGSKQSLADVGHIAPPGALGVVLGPAGTGEDDLVGFDLRGHYFSLRRDQDTLCFVGAYVNAH